MPSESFLDLQNLSFAGAVSLGQTIRRIGSESGRQADAAQAIVNHLYDVFREPESGEPSAALVRCFQTHAFADLPAAIQGAARFALDATPAAVGLRCLTLLGTRGACEAWNRAETSVGHRVIPLPDIAMIERAPMIARLLAQLGVEARHVVAPLPSPASLVLDDDRHGFNVFHVEEALGSPYIPAQQTFVEPYGIRSVVGMGGLLPSGELFAMIIFAKVPISREIAELFRTLALSVKLAFLPFADDEVFPDATA